MATPAVQEERVEVAAMKSDYQFGFHDPDQSVFRARKGLDKEMSSPRCPRSRASRAGCGTFASMP